MHAIIGTACSFELLKRLMLERLMLKRLKLKRLMLKRLMLKRLMLKRLMLKRLMFTRNFKKKLIPRFLPIPDDSLSRVTQFIWDLSPT